MRPDFTGRCFSPSAWYCFAFIMIINISLTRILKKGETGMTNDIAVRVHGGLCMGCRTVYTAGACAAWMCFYGHHIYLRGFLHPSSGRHHGVCVRAWNPACDVGILSTASSATKGTFGILGNIIKYPVHCNHYPAHRHAPWNLIRRIPERIRKAGKSGAAD